MEPIFWTSWKNLCEEHGTVWETGDSAPVEKIVYVTADHFDSFIKEKFELKDKTIVSAGSDFGFHEYDPRMHEQDMRRFWPMLDISKLNMRDLHYPARLNPERCISSDIFCVRSYSWMMSTFSVKSNFRWFATNNCLNFGNKIPFGCQEEEYHLALKYKGLPKKQRIFVCFSSNTNERHSLKEQLKNKDNFYVKDNIDKEEFVYDLATSTHCLSLPGNGKDLFRNALSIYLDTRPTFTKDCMEFNPYGDLASYISFNDMTIVDGAYTNKNLVDLAFWRGLIIN